MSFAAIAILLGSISAAAFAQTCGEKEATCLSRCGAADAMDFKCELKTGAIVSSCACASLSRRAASASSSSSSTVTTPAWCTDELPTGDTTTCEDRLRWGQCNSAWIKLGNYCRKTCFGCTCEDVEPRQPFTCKQQVQWGKCGSSWMMLGKYCEKSCGECGELSIQ